MIREEKRLQNIKNREEERRREDNLREERREARERQAREEAEEREAKLLATLKEAQPAIPQTVHLDNTKLPSMVKGEDLETFIDLFESALTVGAVPENKWVAKLHSALDTETKLSINDTITNPDSSYEEIKQALIGQSHLTFTAASEAIMTLDQGDVTKLPMRQALQRLTRLFEKATAEATTIREACLYSAVAVARFALNTDAKQYIDVKGSFDCDNFCRSIEEWQRTHIGKPVWNSRQRPVGERQTARFTPGRKPGTCYHCGKGGHFAYECRSRLAGERQTAQPPEMPSPTQQVAARRDNRGNKPDRDLSEVTCFRCRQKGHISPNCPKNATPKIKRVLVQEDQIQVLGRNDIFGAVGPHRMPVTCDTGAEVTVVPEEAVEQDQLTGETCELRSFNDGKSVGKRCRVQISVDGTTFTKEAVTQPGKALGWSVCLSLNLTDPEERDFLMQQITRRAHMRQEDVLYVPPEVREGILVSGIPVSEAKVVKCVKSRDKAVPLQSATEAQQRNRIDTKVEPVQSAVAEAQQEPESEVTDEPGERKEVDEMEVVGDVLGKELILEKEEEGGVALGGRAETEGNMELQVQAIREGMPVEEMATETRSDTSLKAIIKLAELDKDGYHLSKGLVFRTRLDTFGLPREQLCVPQSFRQQCLKAAHTSFGHQGRNRMVALLKPYFYWPCMGKDCVQYVKSCHKCQEMDKTIPRPPTMTERQVVTRPFSNVSVDVVGPFPTARGGFRFMLTCIDSASRWPEAFPVRKVTARTVIGCLTTVFTRWGFPEKLTSDNGSQFTSKVFAKWLREKGIAHARATPYHPQGNGIVERLHRTLNSVIAKTIQCKGDWAAVLPMALFFLRCTPSTSTGISPFLLTHGWEPANPIQLLYQAWVDSELGGVDLTEWVLDNADRVEVAREQATISLIENSRARAVAYNKKARDRKLVVGDRVWVRRPGLDHKLRESWVGPGTILKENSPISFRVQTPDRIIPTVNIQQLKLAGKEMVKKITAVVEDTDKDELTNSFASAKLEGQVLTGRQQQQLDEVLLAHQAILTKDPGLTTLVKFNIDTGDADPIQQRPYSTPVALKASVDDEITWLLNKGYIVPSSSPWASPMVTVRKADGSARLCVDFCRVNSLTRQTPFFMPRVEEVIEGIGRAKFISKLDLSKGFYQVELADSAMEKMAFTCHRGAFHFTRMPFGVKNAPACFQSLMQRVLAGLDDFATAYMDDVVIFSSTWEDHVTHIGRVLGAIGNAGLTVNPTKCCWGGTAVEFLGHFVGKGSMSIPAHRTTALETYTRPRTKRGLRAFLGSVGFYRRYLQKLANWTSTLTPLTSKQAPQIVEWTDEGVSAFKAICNFFCSPPNLCVPLPSDSLSIVCDASGKGVGGILQVQRDGVWTPSAYYSRQLRGAEHRYSATELEALALVETVKHFSYHLYGRQFTAFTDHRPLEQLMTSTRLNPRLARLAFKLQHWLIQISYLPGERNTLADALSREERTPEEDPRQQEEDASVPGRHLAAGDVEGTPPQKTIVT